MAAMAGVLTLLDGTGHGGENTAMFVTMGADATLDLSGLTVTGFVDANDRIGVTGDSDAETITGTSRADEIHGNGGADSLTGRAGDDLLEGGAGNDTLNGETGKDRHYGGDDNDLIIIGAGDDTVGETYDGGAGSDTLRIDSSAGNTGANIRDDVFLDMEFLELTGGLNADWLVFLTGFGQDTITDFADPEDILAFDDAIWGGGMTEQQVVDTYATVVLGNTVFDFGSGMVLTVDGIVSEQMLVDNIVIF